MWARDLEWIDPVEAAARLAGLGSLCFLDSAMAQKRLGRFSYIGVDPFGRFTVRDGTAHWNGSPETLRPLEALKQRLELYRLSPPTWIAPLPGWCDRPVRL